MSIISSTQKVAVLVTPYGLEWPQSLQGDFMDFMLPFPGWPKTEFIETILIISSYIGAVIIQTVR